MPVTRSNARGETRTPNNSRATSSQNRTEKDGKRPAKRARKEKQIVEPTPPPIDPKERGCLNMLPSLPLDVLFEIFSHLLPGDLLRLSRTNQVFNSVLLSRQSTVLWKESTIMANEAGYPPRPDDVSEIEWAELVFGGPWCTACGARTGPKALWTLRRRLCKSCLSTRLVTCSMVEAESEFTEGVDLRVRDLIRILPCERVSYSFHFWKEDVKAYRDELKDLRDKFPNDDEWEKGRIEFDKRKAAEMKRRNEHAKICSKREETKANERGKELAKIKAKRFEQVKTRLIDMGYSSLDAEHPDIRYHTEVNNTSNLNDRVWKRVFQHLHKTIDRVRDQRLKRERHLRAQQRIDTVASMHGLLLQYFAPSSTSFAPSLFNLLKFNRVAGLAYKDVEVTNAFRDSMREAIVYSIPEACQWIQRRAESLRRALPDHWPRYSPGSGQQAISMGATKVEPGVEVKIEPEVEPKVELKIEPTTKLKFEPKVEPKIELDPEPIVDIYEFVADLDLAVYAIQCNRCTKYCSPSPTLLFGLDILAHHCDSHSRPDSTVRFETASRCHESVLQIMALLDMDATRTTPLDLDVLDKIFVCATCCKDKSKFWGAGVRAMTWRKAVQHCLGHSSALPELRLANAAEEQHVNDQAVHSSLSAWGCCHCQKHLILGADVKSPRKWFKLLDLQMHLKADHRIENGVEGVDMYFDRQKDRLHYTVPPSLPLELSYNAAAEVKTEG